METIKIYLAGACKFAEDEGIEWREKAKMLLEQAAENVGVKVQVINPTSYFSYSEAKHKTHKQVKSFYMNKILHCTLMLVNLQDSALSVGTGMEVQYAVDHDIPIIGFNPGKNSYPWIEEVDCEVAWDTMLKAIDYIRDYYFVV